MSDLSPRPEAATEKPDLHPGGADALELDPDGEGLGRDLPPEDNPAVEDAPAEVKEPDDKDQAPTGEADQEAGTRTDADEDGPEAGQVDEKGDPEPPA